MDIVDRMGRAARAASDALAGMSWWRVLTLCALGLMFAVALPKWLLMAPIRELMPLAVVFCLILKVESGARRKAVDAEGAAKADAMRSRGEAQAWSSRLDSHFLFNAMATVSHLIEADPKLAAKAQAALAAYLRSGLSEPEASSVSSQASACRSYLEIQEIRLGERLSWTGEWSAQGPMPGRVAIGLLELAVGQAIEPKIDGGALSIACSKEGAEISWRMGFPQGGVAEADFEPWKARWMAQAPRATWSANESEGRWTIALGWSPSQE